MDQDIWQNILDDLEQKIAPDSFKTWFLNTTLIEISKDTLIVQVPTKFASDYLNNNYSALCGDISDAVYNKRYTIRFSHESLIAPEKPKNCDKQEVLKNLKLNPRYTFDDFVVGKNNNFAHSAALAIAEMPGCKYNPLFLYGESGMGKTHLMQAIGHYTIENAKNMNVYYVPTEEFTNEMIAAIRTNTTQQFRNKFRNIDLLLIDDIHFLSKREGSQEEFFHTFNALYENKKQIVITSDRSPKDIPDLENRLVTRFQWGLLADLKNPDFETRIAILKKKVATENIILSDDIMDFIGERITTNVRLLEGSLIRILAFCSCNKILPENLDIETVEDILSDMITIIQKEVTMDTIFQKVCRFYNITPAQLLDKTRKADIAFPRQIAMYLSNLLIPSISLKNIAGYYRRNDHTTVIHAKRMIENKCKDDNNFRMEIEKLIKEIRGT
jgi:chromosomal replication initiator protein